MQNSTKNGTPTAISAVAIGERCLEEAATVVASNGDTRVDWEIGVGDTVVVCKLLVAETKKCEEDAAVPWLDGDVVGPYEGPLEDTPVCRIVVEPHGKPIMQVEVSVSSTVVLYAVTVTTAGTVEVSNIVPDSSSTRVCCVVYV